MSSTILELKENIQNKPPDYSNGEFNVNLKNSLTLQNGSSVVMRNIFIDTVASSGGMITVEEDTEVSMTFVRGFNFSVDMASNSGTVKDSILIDQNNLGYNFDLNISQNDKQNSHIFHPANKGDSHVYYETIPNTVPAGHNKFRVAEFMTFGSDFEDHYRDHYGGFAITFQYYDINGNLQTYPTSLNNIKSPKEGGDDAVHQQSLGENTFIYDSSRNFGNGGVAVVSPSASSMIKDHTTNPTIAFGGTPFTSGEVYTPNYQKVKVVIPAGAYDPNNLARLITDGFVKVNQEQDKLISGNASLPFTSTILAPTDNECYDAGGTAIFISDSSQVALRVKKDDTIGSPVNRPITGASEFAFVFDGGEGGTQTFKFTSLHSPFYVNTAPAGQPTNLSIGNRMTPINVGTGGTPEYLTFNDNKKGDILITALEPFNDFWVNKLGIGGSCICQMATSDFKIDIGGGATSVIKVPKFQIQVGINMTEPFLGTDVLVPKDTLIPAIADYSTVQIVPNLNTISIFGEKTLNQITNINGYFLIEIRGYNNGTRVIGSNNVDDISAIVSRYYTSPSYTNGYSSDSIVYTHKGQPIELSNFTVRILDPDRTPAVGIGVNSCVYLSIVEGQQDQEEIDEE